jgi:hypothetical protein
MCARAVRIACRNGHWQGHLINALLSQFWRRPLSETLGSATRLLFGIVRFAGLPLLGWGVMDIPGFAGDPVRLPLLR